MTEHTPGPWIVRNFDDALFVVASHNLDIDVCDVTDRPSQNANATLIAAAPALLAAAEAALERIRAEGCFGEFFNELKGHMAPATAELRAAISQARGEA